MITYVNKTDINHAKQTNKQNHVFSESVLRRSWYSSLLFLIVLLIIKKNIYSLSCPERVGYYLQWVSQDKASVCENDKQQTIVWNLQTIHQ